MSESDNTQLSSSLSWVKEEINKALQEARASLEAYVEGGDAADKAKLQRCEELIKQVRGTLQMVQLQGALLLTEEMLHSAGSAATDQRSTRSSWRVSCHCPGAILTELQRYHASGYAECAAA